jgi:hypothetical protein
LIIPAGSGNDVDAWWQFHSLINAATAADPNVVQMEKRGRPMRDETVAEADCVLCRDLDPAQRAAMRADLIVIPLREPVCDQCLEAFAANLFAGFPKTEEERLRRREEMARTTCPKG